MKKLLIFCLLVFSLTLTATAFQPVSSLNTALNIVPDSYKATDEGVRLTVCVMGMPHTSQRIDSVDLHISGKVYKANDIDPIDFERYFQFEDEGLITLEIDFPFMGHLPHDASLTFHTVRGDVKAPARQ